MIKISEKTMQARIIRYVLFKLSHDFVVTNTREIFQWETDVLSIDKAGLSYEFEIKTSRADYLKEFRSRTKKPKLELLDYCRNQIRLAKDYRAFGCVPNFFYYVTHEFDIEPPAWAGWIQTQLVEDHRCFAIQRTTKKRAPRLHSKKMDDQTIVQIAKHMAYRIEYAYSVAHPWLEYKEQPAEPGKEFFVE
jgi:hypothetical protein